MVVIASREQRLPGNKLNNNKSKSPYIWGPIVVFSAENLRASIPAGWDIIGFILGGFSLGKLSNKPKVANNKIILLVQKEILGFDVSVNILSLMKITQSLKSLPHKFDYKFVAKFSLI